MLVTNIFDLRELARRKLPKMFWDYLERGGYHEETLARNRNDLKSLALTARVLNDVSQRNLSCRLLGRHCDFPLILAPVGGCGIFHPNGEMHAAKAAQRHGIPFCLSTLSVCTIEDVAEVAPLWFQLYLFKDRGLGRALIQRAIDAKCPTLVMSMDVHVRSSRYSEQKDGLTAPPKINVPNVWDVLSHPSWFFSMMKSKRRTFGNLATEIPQCKTVFGATEWLEDQWDPTLSIKDVEWVRNLWPGKLIVKGILHPADAKLAVKAGADAVAISNHGGRQVDGAVSTVSMLPPIVDAVRGKAQILVDSGIRTGIDMQKMLACGADACLVGRAYCYGLAARGERGLNEAIEILKRELDETMALCGVSDVSKLPSDLVVARQIFKDPSAKRAFLG